MIFNIQKCSIHDGDGMRTLVFFKGCGLRCRWCANPESQLFSSEIMESQNKCIGCGRCIKACPVDAIRTEENGIVIDREKCIKCFQCTEQCFAEAKYVTGRDYEVEELFHEIEKDRMFYAMSGGGVTFSGGEPLSQPEFLTAITRRCKEEGIHVMLESCGFADYEKFKTALPYIDTMFMDIKHIDPEEHRKLTGQDNRLILENIRKIADFGIPITVRTPVIPGYNDAESNIRGIAAFIRDIPNIKGYELLAYHNLGSAKYRALGRAYELRDVETPSKEFMNHMVDIANDVLMDSGKKCFYI